MAEIRKHNPTVRDEIDAAILAALGEDVRHVAPGETPPERLSKPIPTTPTVTATFASGLGGAGWTAVDPAAVARPIVPKPVPTDVDDVDEDDEG